MQKKRPPLQAKKETYRFTLKFNESLEEHRQAAKILNAFYRKKSDYLVEAILFYEKNKDQVPYRAQDMPPAVSETDLDDSDMEDFVNLVNAFRT